jgi:hypothetical protein
MRCPVSCVRVARQGHGSLIGACATRLVAPMRSGGVKGRGVPASSCWPVHAGRSRRQGGAPDWTSDLDAGEDRRRIRRREGRGRSTELVSQAPIRASHAGRIRMTMASGPGCSVSVSAVSLGACDVASAPGVVTFSDGWGSNILEDVKRAGQQLAGDRYGGDLPAPTGGCLGVEAGERRAVLAFWAASSSTHRTHGDPCLVMWPWRTLRSQVAHRGGEPAPGAQLAGGREATDLADLGDQGHGGDRPDARQRLQGIDAGVGLGTDEQVPLEPGHQRGDRIEQAATIIDDGALDGWELKVGQPGPTAVVHSRSCTRIQRSASTACTRHLAAVAMRPSHAR